MKNNSNTTIPAVIRIKSAKKLYSGRVKKLLKNKNFNIVQCGLYDNDAIIDLPEAPEEIKLVW